MRTRNSRAQCSFTLIELLVVVAVIAIISGLLLPVLLQVRDRARKNAAQQNMAGLQRVEAQADRKDADSKTVPSGPLPILDAVVLNMTLTPSYHRIGMDVFTRYRVDCTGRIVFRLPDNAPSNRVLLHIPFPDNALEARDVQLAVHRMGQMEPLAPLEVAYTKKGIYCVCRMENGQALAADVSFTALGREQLDYALPPARQIRSLAVTLNLPAEQARIIPDDALQPSSSGPGQIRWEFRNLVSDRRITVAIPGAEAPLARVLLLSRLVAFAVLLFGAGFWYLSELARPGQLDSFRLGHFLLLALTYSLFFVIFAVLEFHGGLGTPVSMVVAAVFSLPLLVLHVSRVLNRWFAITQTIPLALFTLGLVINGVYGAALRDYVFIGAAILVIAYVTLTYQAWAAGRERYQHEREAAYAAGRRTLTARITNDIGALVAQLSGLDAQAAEYVKISDGAAFAEARSRLEQVREPVSGLVKEYEELAKGLSYIPAQASLGPQSYRSELERKAEAFRDRVEAQIANLQAELATYRSARNAGASTPESSQIHCLACGHVVPDTPFCPQCGAAHPRIVTCGGCGERITIPLHLLAKTSEEVRPRTLFCPRCGTPVPFVQAQV